MRQPVYDAFVLFIDATLTLLQGDYEKSTRLVDAGLELGRKSHGATPSRPGPGTCSCRPGTRAGWRRSSRCSRAWRDRGVADLGHRPRRVRPRRRQTGTGPRDGLAALVDDEVHISDNSLWLTSVGLLVEVARAVGDVERCEVLLRELTPVRRQS